MNEQLLSHLWRSQTFDRGVLPSADGGTLQIVYPGRPNPHDGPDFLDAIVALRNGALVTGDVELHVRSSDWRAHGHQHDVRYNSVVLHVVWTMDRCQVTRQDGELIPTVALGQMPQAELWAAGSITFIVPPTPDPCRRRSTALGSDVFGETLDRAGEERFLSKAAKLEGELNCRSAEEVLYTELMTSLGYSRNQGPFRRLAVELPLSVMYGFAVSRQDPVKTLAALLLGAAGFLPPVREGTSALDDSETSCSVPFDRDPGFTLQRALPEGVSAGTAGVLARLGGCGGGRGRPRSQEIIDSCVPRFSGYDSGEPVEDALRNLWAWSGLQPLLSETDWQRSRVRPENSPVRRLTGMALILGRNLQTGLLNALLSILRGGSARKSLLLREFCVARCEPALSLPLQPGHECIPAASTLIGAGRAAEIVVNVLLPFVWALGQQSGDELLCQRAMEIYRAHPATDGNHVTRQMCEQLWGDRRGGNARSALRHQGLLHLFHRYCRRRICVDCPAALEPAASTA